MPRSRTFDLARALDYLARTHGFRKSLENRKRRRKRNGEGGELMPVEPDRRNTLSGGGAAALEFDE